MWYSLASPRLSVVLLWLLLALSNALNIDNIHGYQTSTPLFTRAPLQDIVTWDSHSLFVNGTRIFFYSGEIHPFRIPVPGLWLDVFQKVKAMGFNGVSFYVDWALLEGEPGTMRTGGIFDLDPFFAAASQAGIYLLARPGPYINAEVSGGGFPGWLQRVDGIPRTNESAYVDATKLYVSTIGQIIARAQITNGGPVILLQVENEYSIAGDGILFPDDVYFARLEQMYLDAGIVVPLTVNDAAELGTLAPSKPAGADIYGYDYYPLRFDCQIRNDWPAEINFYTGLSPNFYSTHEIQAPTVPNFIPEFQGGSSDEWGSVGYDACLEMTGVDFQRVLWKNNIASAITMNNFYMIYGGTNWGNLGEAEGYTSYDYGAVISEERLVNRQKYSEAKLIANFLQTSPAILTAVPGNISTTLYANKEELSVTPMSDVDSDTKFYVVRHTNYTTYDITNYKIKVNTSQGVFNLPKVTGHLRLSGRDSKIHVTDYKVGKYNLLYSTAEIFTWGNDSTKTILAVYGDIGERHELAFSGTPDIRVIPGAHVDTAVNGSIVNFKVGAESSYIVINGDLFVYLLNRQDAYNWWVLPISAPGSKTPSPGQNPDKFIASAGYLLRNVTVSGSKLDIVGDLNATSPLEIHLGAPANLKTLTFNGKRIPFTQDSYNVVRANTTYTAPTFSLPTISSLTWKQVDSLPEIQNGYDDSLWPSANKSASADTNVQLLTPTSLISSDYGFHAGSVLFRGHMMSNSTTAAYSNAYITVQGGMAFGFSLWLNSTFIGSWTGTSAFITCRLNFTFPSLKASQPYVLTVLQDFMGYEEQFETTVTPSFKTPRGILDYDFGPIADASVAWKITGNLGGEHYADLVRGPLNEGGMFAERQGWHLPAPPSQKWAVGSPMTGIKNPGVMFYTTSFHLDLPRNYDIPLSFVFGNNTVAAGVPAQYRVQLYVNGYQYGEYINHIGPQSSFPVHTGILNPNGLNYLALTLWAATSSGAKLDDLRLQATGTVQTGYGKVELSPMPKWTERVGAY